MPVQTLKQAWAVYPSVKLKGFKTDSKTKEKKFAFIKELLFGDFLKPYITNGKYDTISIKEHGEDVEYIKVRARGVDGYIKEEEMQADRILEVNFIDVGQGDGCHLITPDDKHFIIDAGPTDNMYRFLKWRFNLNKSQTAPPPFTAIVSHSDSDHYKGFDKLFSLTKGANQQFSFNKIYHNGLVELSGSKPDSLGTIVSKNGENFITDLCDSNADYKKRANAVSKPGVFITTMNKSTAPKKSLRLGSDPVYEKGTTKIEVLAPVAKKIDGKDALPVFASNKGKTKNGHSIVLKLTIGKLRLLLGGDLNTESENYLLSHYSGKDIVSIKKQLKRKTLSNTEREQLKNELDNAIEKTRPVFEVDIAKSCHHGSADFTSEFMKALNPVATVISSGDNEPHTHPRPDTLGTIGKHSRGDRSLIFCTELARSSKEFVELLKSKSANKRERVVLVYGMINVRSDGEKVIIAQKLERNASGRSWDIHKIEWNEKLKQFEYIQFLKNE